MVFKQGLLGIVKEGYGLREDCDIVLWIWNFVLIISFRIWLLWLNKRKRIDVIDSNYCNSQNYSINLIMKICK